MAQRDLLAFGETVRQQRARLSLSQEDLAERCALHRTYVGGVERGERNLGLMNIYRIADALGVPAAELFAAAEPFRRATPRRRGPGRSR